MRKINFSIFVMAAVLLAVGFVFTACDTGGGGGGSGDTVTYTGSAGGTQYRLTITASSAKAAYNPKPDDLYVLVIGNQRSEGTVTNTSGGFTLKPNGATVTFTVKVNGSGITNITGTITLVGGGGPVQGPGEVTPGAGGSTDNGATPTSLSGTTWVGSGPGKGGWTGTFVFTTGTAGTYTEVSSQYATWSLPFTYTYNPSSKSGSLTLMGGDVSKPGSTHNFTVNGNTLTLNEVDAYTRTK
jgi:hypothetical protein